MSKRYVLSSAVITAPGLYAYSIADVETAKLFFSKPGWISCIGYAETAQALSQIVGIEIPMNRVTAILEPSDMALIFRLVLPPGSPRLDPAKKGSYTVDYVIEHCEIGLLQRIE